MCRLSWIVLFWLDPAVCQAGYVTPTIDIPVAAGPAINDNEVSCYPS